MDWKSIGRAIAHAAIGGLATGLSNVPAGIPITAGNVLVPAMLSSATSAYSALSDATSSNPYIHAAIGFAPVAVYSLITGDHSTLATAAQSLVPALVSGLTSAGSSKMNVNGQTN